MKFSIVIEDVVHQSIERNVIWWEENHSPDEAMKWQREIYDQLRELRVMPERHSIARENDKFPFELRQQLLGTGKRKSYRALFTIRGSTVHVLEFLAAEQDDVDSSDLQLP